MSTAVKIIIGFFVLTIGSVLAIGGYVMSVRSSANRMEKNVVYQYEQNKNNYDKMWKTFKETAQVTDMYAGDVQKLFSQVIEGRKGSDQELFRMIKESNPTLDASIYKRLQEVIEAGRSDFEENQKMLLDKKKQYATFLDEIPEGPIASFFGFPKVDLNQFQIVTSDRTEGTFKSGKDDEVKLR